jgi:hypothetical protein
MPEIVSRRLVQADAHHDHVELVGAYSDHLKREPITLSVERTQERMSFGERFWITVDGQQIDVKPGTCSVCGHEPYLRTAADAESEEKLLGLPEG